MQPMYLSKKHPSHPSNLLVAVDLANLLREIANIHMVIVLRAYMGLTCKIGCYNRVIEKLTEMDIPIGNIFLLYGPIDVLVRLDGFNSLKEFVDK